MDPHFLTSEIITVELVVNECLLNCMNLYPSLEHVFQMSDRYNNACGFVSMTLEADPEAVIKTSIKQTFANIVNNPKLPADTSRKRGHQVPLLLQHIQKKACLKNSKQLKGVTGANVVDEGVRHYRECRDNDGKKLYFCDLCAYR